METPTEESQVQAKVLASAALIASSAKASSALDAFVSWLLAGCGAALALIVSNLASLTTYISAADLRMAAIWVVVGACLVAVQKYIAAIIGATASADETSRALIKPLLEAGVEIDVPTVLSEVKRAVFPPARWLVSKSFTKQLNGDYASPGRSCAKWGQVQGGIALAAAAVLIWAMWVIARAIGA